MRIEWIIAMNLYYFLWVMCTEMFVECASVTSHVDDNSIIISSNHSDRCMKHSDCNPILRKLLHQMNENDQTNIDAFNTLNRNPKIMCVQFHCQCDGHSFVYDANDQICRSMCRKNNDCLRQREDQSKQSPKNLNSLLMDEEEVAQICANDHLCRCPEDTAQNHADYTSCVVTGKRLSRIVMEYSLTVGTIILLLIIIFIPIWTMIRKQREYNEKASMAIAITSKSTHFFKP